ncbi:hypothetical protein [Microbulbifer spongiae]|uniref:Uncharacterized protein n=1 Tax=Microbulbifer spongiae TaxID=2944933 RepID=A0ABY9EEC0_9GAMM|nr:hypothetical protein [Microbulbifer sp. MI-G]WKD51373.1 hypothetical protein M8T91_08125 [Microbulbifer sp. MI-G]
MVNFKQRHTKGNALRDTAIEGKDLMFDAWLSEQLQFGEPYLDDNGFCDRVMAELPVSSKRAERRASGFQYLAVLAASGIVAWQFPFGEVLSEAARQSISLYSLVGMGMLSSLVAMVGGILAARH